MYLMNSKLCFLALKTLPKSACILEMQLNIHNTWGFAKYVFDIFHLCICLPWEVGYMSKAPKGWGWGTLIPTIIGTPISKLHFI